MDISSIKLSLAPPEKYPAKQHAQRVARKLNASKGLIYLLGQYALNIEDSDQQKTWRQRRYFYYCSGVDVPNCCLTYDIEEDDLVLYIPQIDRARVIWQGRPPTIDEAKDAYDFDDVRHNEELFDDLQNWQARNKIAAIYILHEDHKPDLPLSYIDVEHLQYAIDQCRAIKDHYEVERIRTANEVSAAGHVAVLRNIRYFSNEAQIQGIFVGTSISRQALQAYNVIAGSGENAAVLHYSDNNEPLKGRQLVCLDAGAQWENYASDVTRTFPISGSWPTVEAQAVYKIVEEMQETTIGMLKPGIRMFELHVMAAKIAIKGLIGLGILKGSSYEIFASGTYRGFYPHGLGHHVGLEVHDVLGIPIMRYGTQQRSAHMSSELLAPCGPDQPTLEEGMVVTIEPGIYFSRYELKRAYLSDPVHSKFIDEKALENYWGVGGVRIEDNLLITAKGYENLTTAPKGEAALEIIRKGHDSC